MNQNLVDKMNRVGAAMKCASDWTLEDLKSDLVKAKSNGYLVAEGDYYETGGYRFTKKKTTVEIVPTLKFKIKVEE